MKTFTSCWRALPGVTLVFLVLAWQSAGAAETYPAKPVRAIVPWSAGSSPDVVTRYLASKFADRMGQAFVVDNRPGAAGMMGAELVAKAAPDGYTIMMAHIAAISILPSLISKMPYDAQKDLVPITLVAIGPNLLVVHPSVPVKTVKELIALAKARPGQLQYASPGAGTVQHLAGELFKLQAKVDILHVPYKGSGQSIIDLIAGQVHMDFDAIPPVINYVRQGKLRAIAVTSAKRFSLLPEIPTVEESGVPGFDMSTWWGLVAPAKTPMEIVARLNAATLQALSLLDKAAGKGVLHKNNAARRKGRLMRQLAALEAKK